MDSVSRKWDYVISKKGDEILGVFPFDISTSIFGNKIVNPLFTNRLGPVIFDFGNQSDSKRTNFEKEVIFDLIDKLPNHCFFDMGFSYNLKNWLPFFWKSFKQTTKYSYVLDLKEDYYNNFSSSKKRDIKKASKSVAVSEDNDFEKFYDFHKSCLLTKGDKISYDKTVLERIGTALTSNPNHHIFLTAKSDCKVHSSALTVYDEDRAYFLISAIDPEKSNSSSLSLLIYETMKRLEGKTKLFDFEGSMNFNIHESFRHFGGYREEYHNIYKYSKFYKLKYFME
ncbi:MAG: hypothetical protein JXR48_09305 [Candidatus Delongbacteria bacterium]|nr:hypothetical protein [Candidatus Delongbacteria bacterium]